MDPYLTPHTKINVRVLKRSNKPQKLRGKQKDAFINRKQ